MKEQFIVKFLVLGVSGYLKKKKKDLKIFVNEFSAFSPKRKNILKEISIGK